MGDNNCQYGKYCSKTASVSVSPLYYKGFQCICGWNYLIVNDWHEICIINKKDVGFYNIGVF